jgi:PAS domain S-box-containing protein
MESFFDTAARADEGGLVGAFGWLWLPVLLVAVAVLLASPRWRAGVARSTTVLAGFAAAVAAGETAWWLLGDRPAYFPLTSWAVTLLVTSLAASALSRREPAAAAVVEDRSDPPRSAPAVAVEVPFRPPADAAADRSWAERALEQSADAVAVVDLDGRIELVNAAWARWHGFQAEEARGHHLSVFHTPDQMDEVRRRMAAALEDGTWTGESRHRRKDGGTFTLRSSLSLLRDAAGEPAGFVAIARRDAGRRRTGPPASTAADVSAPAELETLRMLVAGVAHEYNNLLTGILGNATLLSRKVADADVHHELADVESAARHAADLTRQLQAYCGNVRARFESLDLGAWLERSFDEVVESLGDGGVVVHRDLGAPALVSADARQMRIVLANLVANAVDALGHAGGEITLRAGRCELDREALDGMVLGARRGPGAYGYLEVADTGHGLESQTRKRMFDPYYTTRQGRQGLGLTTVLGIVRSHRGAIAAGSLAGETRVRVVFPCAGPARAVAAPAVRETSPPPRAWQGSGTILVVDDERIIRDLATSILEIHGFSVLTAADGEPALALYRECRDDIRAVLLDLSMPLMDGREAFERLRELDPRARVIVMTGHSADDVRDGFSGEGLAGVLQKPFRPEQLIGLLRETLGG